MTTEFHISRSRQAGILAFMLLACALCGLIAWERWDLWYMSGLMLTLALGFGAVAAVLIWTMVTRPVMLRVSPEGIYIHRLNVELPWESIAQVSAFNYRGHTMIQIAEVEGGHPAWEKGSIRDGEMANEAVGLPPLALSFARYEGDAARFLAAVRAAGPEGASKVDQE